MDTPHSVVNFHLGYNDKFFMNGYKNLTEEQVQIWSIRSFREVNYPHIPNLDWLIPMALNVNTTGAANDFIICQNTNS